MKQYLPFFKAYKKALLISTLLVMADVVFEIVQPALMSQIVDRGIQERNIPYILETGGLMVFLSLLAIAVRASGTVVMVMPTMQLVMNVSIVAILWLGGGKIMAGSLHVGELISFITYITQILMSLMMLSMTIMTFSRASASSGRVLEVLNATVDINDSSKALQTNLAITRGKIEFRNVFFKYHAEGNAFVLKHINLTVQPGETIALIGAPAAGTPASGIPATDSPPSGTGASRLTPSGLPGRRGRIAIEKPRDSSQVIRRLWAYLRRHSGKLLLVFLLVVLNTAATGGLLALLRGLDIGGLAAFLQYSRQFGRPVNEISSQFNNLQAGLASTGRIFQIMDEPPEPADAPDAVRLDQVKGDVQLDHVTFGYDPGKIILKDISLHAVPGQKIALVGATGAGKTTIASLLPRFYDIQSGQISIDHVDIRKITRDSLRRSLAMVLQDTHLFTGTVMENIRYGRLAATDEEVIAAARLASADSFIKRLPNGYQTILENDGSNLSTVRNADEILVLEGGVIVERGTHQSLLQQKGKYYELYATQFD